MDRSIGGHIGYAVITYMLSHRTWVFFDLYDRAPMFTTEPFLAGMKRWTGRLVPFNVVIHVSLLSSAING
jgi:hypothetical protein